ncbi:Gfo/Idh/MocA family oxidoreductase [Paenibacillus sp. Root52]|uniref:Gfo/Idh/MocA family oxidoreductase n=1 Tax=Paenibacillus sp. Root52 TaxID=1736552 RepID=UPI00138F7592|nr:Gfo/Idh/MocA family oxidoreductase [Paenibacillus sp. Root52]
MIRWGILGAGYIATRFATALQHEPSSKLYAISGRSESKLKDFADKYATDRQYVSHDEMLLDPNVDAIYLALPHHLHHEWAIKALEAGKAVLCEKPVSLNLKEMQDIAEIARSKNVLFMEAMKQRFVPLYIDLRRRVEAGEIGTITSIQTSFCNQMPDGMNTYHVQPGPGGSLLDVGTYCASWIEDFSSGSIKLETVAAAQKDSIDYYIDAKLHVGHVNAQLECAFDRQKERKVVLQGERGSIVVEDLHRPVRMLVLRDGYEPEKVEIPYEFDDFYSEIHHFVECLKNGRTESDIMSLTASLRCAEILDTIRAGLSYTPECLDVLKEQEEILRYDHFGAAEALKLGNIIAELAKEYDREIAVSIIRESDELVLFQYMMDSKARKNISYMEGKRRAAKLVGHSSLWMHVDHVLNKKWNTEMENIPHYIPTGGAFPIRVHDEWVATLALSGLHEGRDHELIVRALSRALEKQVSVFPSAAI